jgi:hypothetical protein
MSTTWVAKMNKSIAQLDVFFMFDYLPESGELVWRERPPSDFASEKSCKIINTKNIGKTAGSMNKTLGYRVIRINRVLYYAHRLIWIYHHGDIESGLEIDHVNGDKADNRIVNLRLASHAQNSRNVSKRSNNSSGHKGVYWHSQAQKFHASIHHNGCNISLGLFETAEDAAAAYARVASKLHGEFLHPSLSGVTA